MRFLTWMTLITLLNAAPAFATETRTLDKEVVVPASIQEVWRSWTTEDGLRFVSSDSRVELRPGGAYEWFVDLEPDAYGRRGGEGAEVRAFLEPELLAFSWTFPPSIPELRHGGETTEVVVRLAAVSETSTRVRLQVHGFEQGAAWAAGYDYFDQAWDFVLKTLREHHQKAGEATAKSWIEGGVTVSVTESPRKTQSFETEFAAPRTAVWELVASEEGFRKIGAPEPTVELRSGGPYKLWPGAPNRVLAFLPGEMIATTGSAPEKFPTVREGGTWSVIELEDGPDGTTHFRMVVDGWRPGEEEWDAAFDYFLEANVQYLEMLRGTLAKSFGP